jgi:multimeric flavodoxin WrbA
VSVVALVASPRRGNTLFLVDEALAELRRLGAACERIVLSEHEIGPCEGHVQCRDLAACAVDDEAADILAAVFAADGLLLASPVYFQNVSAQMKTLMDRTCWHYEHEMRLRTRAAGLIAVAENSGLRDTLDAMRRYIALIGDVPCFEASGWALKPGDTRANATLIADVRRMAAEIADALGLAESAPGGA